MSVSGVMGGERCVCSDILRTWHIDPSRLAAYSSGACPVVSPVVQLSGGRPNSDATSLSSTCEGCCRLSGICTANAPPGLTRASMRDMS